jgi:hypothetical protein
MSSGGDVLNSASPRKTGNGISRPSGTRSTFPLFNPALEALGYYRHSPPGLGSTAYPFISAEGAAPPNQRLQGKVGCGDETVLRGGLKLRNGRCARGFGEISRFLILGVDESDTGQTDEREDVPQVRLLIIICGGRSAGAKRTSARGEDYNLLAL